MKHIIVTKFNLNNGSGNHLKEEWLKDRIDLFKKWAYPSVRNQSVQDFTWLVFCSKYSPAWMVSEMADIANDYENMKPQYLVDDVWSDTWKDWMSRIHYHAECPDLFTTRLDSDDAIIFNYIELSRNVAAGNFCMPLHGYMCKDGMVYLRKYGRNPFATLHEYNNNVKAFRTVNKHQHCNIPGEEIDYSIFEVPGWIQHAHDNTGWNKLTIREKDMISKWFPLDQISKEFGICVS